MDGTCSICGKTFAKPAGMGYDMCPACVESTKKRYAAPAEEAPRTLRRAAPALALAVALIGAAVTALRWPAMSRAVSLLHPPAPNPGAADDLCVANLWAVSAALQRGTWAPGTLRCPLTQTPYTTSDQKDGDRTVSCPNPGGHGYKVLRVSKRYPSPEIVKTGG